MSCTPERGDNFWESNARSAAQHLQENHKKSKRQPWAKLLVTRRSVDYSANASLPSWFSLKETLKSELLPPTLENNRPSRTLLTRT